MAARQAEEMKTEKWRVFPFLRRIENHYSGPALVWS
jgi:hypothetical protein